MHTYLLGKMYLELAKNATNIYAKCAYLNTAKYNFELYLTENRMADKNADFKFAEMLRELNRAKEAKKKALEAAAAKHSTTL